MIKKVNNDTFKKEVLKCKEVVLVDFYADWCAPCRMLSSVVEDISKSVKVFKVNVDEEEELSTNYGISSIPCVIAFKDGKEINRSIGLRSKEDILEMVK